MQSAVLPRSGQRSSARRTLILVAALLPAPLTIHPLLSVHRASAQEVLVFPGANSRETYFTVHNVRAAQKITRGAGAKVGILDHSFGMEVHPDLYAGGENFQVGMWGETFTSQSHHGYWMSLVLREIAPEVEIYALNTYSSDEAERVGAMVKAIDWAIDHDLDAVTYSARAFSPEARKILDPAVERAVDAGVVVIFIHYPHPLNLFPSWIGPVTGDDERVPDLNILHYDYTVVFANEYKAFMAGDDDLAQGYRPFLSLSSTAPVTAGFVAMLRSLDPTLSPAHIKEILVAASHPYAFEGRVGERVPDAGRAVQLVRAELARR